MPTLICTRLSKPRRARQGPRKPYADSEARTRRGFAAASVASSRPRPSSAPGRYPTTNTSARATSARSAVRPCGERRSSEAHRLPTVMSGTSAGTSSKPGGSMRRTSAPCAARKRVHAGPASTRVRSRTRMPASGRVGAPRAPVGVGPAVVVMAKGGSCSVALPAGEASQAARSSIRAAQPPCWTTAVSSASAPHAATASVIRARSAASSSFSAARAARR